MTEINVTITGVIVDLYGRIISGPCKLIGEMVYTDLGVGGGPIIPPPGDGKPPDPGKPPGIWGGPIDPYPGHPLPEPPPILPVPPDTPNVPPPGSPPLIVDGTRPVNPIVPPPAVVIDYPGIGKVVVPQPTQTTAPPSPAPA